MKKRLLIEGVLLLLIGCGAWGVLRWYVQRNVILRAPTDEELSRMVSPRFGRMPAAPAVMPLMNPSGPIRLAIGGFGFQNEARNGALEDLVLADMTGAKGFVLVDRQSLDKVLQELQINLSGLVRASDAVRVGKMLKADWFLFGSSFVLTNKNESVVARVVDVRTGVMRDVGIFPTGGGEVDVARRLALFVQGCRDVARRAKPHLYLAIGSFGDVGVNNRQADFPDRLRAYLISAYRGSDKTLLERYYVEALLQEVRLDIAGLTQGNGGPPPPLQSAFWTVDGYFQSFETTRHEVEVQLRVSRAFGGSVLINLRGEPGTILRRVKESIDNTIAHANPLMGLSRPSEIRFQLKAGEDLFTQAAGDLDPIYMVPPGYQQAGKQPQEFGKRRHNMEEAVRAFETVLLLDHENREAKFYLGACFRDASLYNLEKARNYLREPALALPSDHWSEMASLALARSYDWDQNYAEGEKWFMQAGRICKDPSRAAFYRAQAQEYHGKAIGLEGALSGNGPSDSESKAFYDQRVIAGITMEQNALMGKGGGLDDSCGLAGLVQAYGDNKEAAAKALVEFVPKLRTQFPQFMPHLLAAVVTFQLDTNTPVLQEFEKSLRDGREHPDKLLGAKDYFGMLLRGPYYWAMDHKAYSLALNIAEAKLQAAASDPEITFDDRDKVKLAYAYMKLERWTDALRLLDEVGERPFVMMENGPWGNGYIPFVPTSVASKCRQKLGLPPVRNPKYFTIGKALLRVDAFTVASDGLWVAMHGALLQLDFELKTNLQIKLPVTTEIPEKGLCVGPGKVWAATTDAGLLEADKTTGNCRVLTEKDGLLINQMMSLALDGGSLWLGFGHEGVGGLGKLDLQSGRISSFTPRLASNPEKATAYDPSTGPPRHPIFQIACANGQVYVLINGGDLRRYDPLKDQWAGVTQLHGLQLDSFATEASQLVMACSRAQQYVDLIDENQPPNTKHPRTTKLALNADDEKRLQGDPKFAQRVKHWETAMLPTIGVLNLRTDDWQTIPAEDVLPDRATRLAVHGSDVCLGGAGYLCIFDLDQKKMRKICYLPVVAFNRLEFAGDYLWVQVQGYLYRVPISELR